MNIRKLAAVARREYAETVKTKAFLLGILLMPGLIIGMIFLSTKMTVDSEKKAGPIRVVVVDRTGRVAAEMVKLAGEGKESEDGPAVEVEVASPADAAGLEPLKQRVREGKLFGLLVVPAETLQDQGTCTFHMHGSGMGHRPYQVQNLLNEAVKHIRFAEAGLDVQRVEELSRPVAVEQLSLQGPEGRPTAMVASMMTPFAFLFLLFMGVFGVSQGLLTSVIEEKSSRVVEVLLSALSPFELMAGKIVGMAGVGLTMVVLWATVGYTAAVVRHVQYLVQFTHLGQFVLYYLLGFLLISSLLAAVGSACNTLKDAQPMMMPLTLTLIIPMMLWFQISRSPNSALALGLSLLPPVTPFIMILRITSLEGAVPLWQQIVAPIWLAAWVLGGMWAAARVFRVGLLMYGKTPGFRELVKWVGYR